MVDKSTPVSAGKVSGPELFRRLDEIGRLVNLQLCPQAMYVYKPRGDGAGNALKLELRLTPSWNEKGYLDSTEGGLFLELATQIGKGDDGYARFGWKESLVAKLGVPDVTAFLTSIRAVRYLGGDVPAALRPKKDDTGMVVGLFHKFESGTTAIGMKFEGDGSYVSVSKSKEQRASIRLTLSEELQLEYYLQMALRAFHLVGK